MNDDTKQNEQEINPILEYFAEIFSPVHSNDFINTLNEDQKKFVSHFILGFETCLQHNIVGIYSPEYIKEKKLTHGIIKILDINCQNIVVKDLDFQFVLVWQWNIPQSNQESENEQSVKKDVAGTASTLGQNSTC